MCVSCWIREGRPWQVTERVYALIPAWKEADEFGDLHIVVDDDNLEDDHIIWCRDEACPKGNNLTSDIDLCNKLLAMSMGERWAVSLLAVDPDFNPDDYADCEE